jgi:threonine/homoserine/homoserine lactone efflux protein
MLTYKNNLEGTALNIFLTYMILGISLAAPIGPVNAAQLNRGIKKGFFHAWIFGIGALLADLLYMMLVYFGVIHFIDSSFMKTFLWIFGFFVLIYSGIESLLSIREIHIRNDSSLKNSFLSSFLSGFIMSVSNPLTIMFWLGIYGSVLAKTVSSSSINQLLLYSAAIIFGILIWDFTMAAVSSYARKFLHSKILIAISFLSSLSMIGFGIYFGYQAWGILFS